MILFLAAILSAAGSDLLVNTADVASLENALVVDVRPASAYETGHIPGALNLDVTSLSEKRDGVTGLLKPLDQVRDLLGKAGLDPQKRIVVYSGMEVADDLKDAARLFWILEFIGYPKVAVLDGGYGKWTREERPIEKGPSKAAPLTLPDLAVRNSLRSNADDVVAAAKSGATIADFRDVAQYSGEKKSGAVKKAGHIPGAINLPADSCVDGESKALLSWDELKSIARKSGIDDSKGVVTVCNTGRSASTGYLVLRLLGHENVSLYDGSMSDWTASGEREVKTGTE